MKFLLNMNLPRELGRLLTHYGHTYHHVGDIGKNNDSWAFHASRLCILRGLE